MRIIYEALLKNYLETWHRLDKAPYLPNSKHMPFQLFKQTIRYYRIRHRLNKLCKTLCHNPEISKKSHESMMSLVSLWLNVDAQNMNQSVSGDYVKTTEAFIKRVRSSWPEIEDDSIFQALRNVWIMNTIQMMAGLPLELTDAMFAYSMLYPLTDNLMDDPNWSVLNKKDFVIRFGKRLKGESIEPIDNHEKDVFDMVALIEEQYERHLFPDVYESLLLIHDAQLMSLKQQYDSPSISELTRLTFNKGAASVVADGYLVLGNPNKAQLDFLMGYGIVLQLADDLQDMTEDSTNNHTTLFSHAKSSDERFQNVIRLLNLQTLALDKLVTTDPKFAVHLRALLSSSMNILIGDAVFEQKAHFSMGILRYLESKQVVRLSQHVKLKALGSRWVDQLKNSDFVRRFE